MPHDIPALLRQAFMKIRAGAGYTQDRWRDRTGIAQSTLSDFERGRTKMETLQRVAESMEQAGIDPLELFRVALAIAEGAEVDAKLVSLIAGLPHEDKLHLLHLTELVATAAAARAGSSSP